MRNPLRPEFASPIILVDPDDPVIGGPRCLVPVCDRLAVIFGKCSALGATKGQIRIQFLTEAAFLRKRGVEERRIAVAWDAIALHTSDGIAERKGTEVALAQAGIGTDILGVQRESLPIGLADDVHALLPRLDLAYALSDAILTQAKAKPQKASPMTFPGELLRRHLPYGAYPAWYDLFNGEDFLLFLRQVPGAMFYLGVANPDAGLNGVPHAPDFAADEEAIGLGVRAMAGLLLSRLDVLHRQPRPPGQPTDASIHRP